MASGGNSGLALVIGLAALMLVGCAEETRQQAMEVRVLRLGDGPIIHPGLHAEGVYEFWEPTLELLLDKARTSF